MLGIRQVLVSKNTHNKWLIGAFTSSEEIVVDDITNLVLGDIADNPNPKKWWLLEMEMKT